MKHNGWSLSKIAPNIVKSERMSDLFKLASQGFLFPKRFIEGRLKKSNKTISSLEKDEGAVLVLEGKKVAVYRSPEDKISKLSPVCTHLGCLVDFNQKEKTWDCPCHGSKFQTNGSVIKGPARKNLEKL